MDCPNCNNEMNKIKAIYRNHIDYDYKCQNNMCECSYVYTYKRKYSLRFKWHKFWMNYYSKKTEKHRNKIMGV